MPIQDPLPPIATRPDRVTLASTSAGIEEKTFEVYSNPSEFSESYAAQYSEPSVLGLTHQPFQYMNTQNSTFDLEFVVDKISIQRRAKKVVDVDDFRRFLKAHLYPIGANQIGSPESAPPALILVWPNVLTARVRLMSLSFTHNRFAIDGTSTFFTAKCSFKRELTERLTFQSVRNKRF